MATESPQKTSQKTRPDADETVKKTGRGFLVITAAKVWFLITGAAVQLGLPIIFGQAELFGVFKIVTEAISLLNMVVITGTLQAVSKLVSEEPERARGVVHLAIKLQLLIGVPLAVAYFVGSPWIAESFNDPALTPYIRLSSGIVLFYAFYAIFVGYLNGMKEFVRQASLDITFATLKTAGILGLVALGFGVTGAVFGFVAASGVICVLSALWVFALLRKGGAAEAPRAPEANRVRLERLAGYLVLVMLYTFALNGVMRADLFILKSVAAEVPAHLVGADEVFKVISDKFAGFYGAVLNVARIPYQGVIAVTFVIFPLISESTFHDDVATTRRYIRTTFRYCLLLIATVAMLLAFNSDSLIAGLYSTDYQTASIALAYLSVSIIFFALFYVATTMIIGSGHPVAAVIIMGASLAVSVVLNWLMVSSVHEAVMGPLRWTAWMPDAAVTTPPAAAKAAWLVAENRVDLAGQYLLAGPRYMEAAAIATTVAMVSGCLAAMGYLGVKFSAWPPLGTVVRLLIAAAAVWGVDLLFATPQAWVVDYGKLVFLAIVVGKMVVMGLVLLGVLAATGEFGREDIDRVKAVLGRK